MNRSTFPGWTSAKINIKNSNKWKLKKKDQSPMVNLGSTCWVRPGLHFQWCPRPSHTGPSCSPGIFRFRSQMLPTVATEGARLVRVMLSLTLPSPLIFTVNGLPAGTEKAHVSSPEPQAQHLQKTQAPGRESKGDPTYRARARQRIWWRRCKPQAPWGSRRPCRCHLPDPPSGCPLCWGLPQPRICRHNLQHSSPGLL